MSEINIDSLYCVDCEQYGTTLFHCGCESKKTTKAKLTEAVEKYFGSNYFESNGYKCINKRDLTEFLLKELGLK